MAPRETAGEAALAGKSGQVYQPQLQDRQIPELPQSPSWQEVLHRAFLANGELEAAYFDWRAALAQVDVASTWPNSNVQLGFGYLLGPGQMKSWDRTTLSAGFDPSVNLSLPNKTAKAGQVALDAAKAAGDRFRQTKFDIQQRVLKSYLQLALEQEQIRIRQDNVDLLQLVSRSAEDRVQAGGPQQDLLKAQIEYRIAENELANLQSQASATRALLNGLLARDPQTPIDLKELPPRRAVPADDAVLIAAGVDQNPELAGLAHQVAGRSDALQLAQMAWLPDISPSVAFTGGISQTLGAAVMLPTTIPMIRGQIEQARAMLRSSQAIARQTQHDRAASFIASLYAMRNAERQADLFQQRILPVSQQALDSSRQSYAAGTVGFVELIDAQRTLLEVRLMVAEARIERETRLAEMESLAGVDVETLSNSTSRAAATPTTDGER